MRKPESILYGTDETPPPRLLVALAAQNVAVVSIFLVTPVTVAQAAALPLGEAIDLVSLTMISLALAALVQIHRRGPLGCGLLVLPSSNAAFLPGSLIAVRLGGMPMLAGLLLVSGLLEVLLSRFMRRLRSVLPTELAGLIVLVTGLSVAQSGMDDIVGGVAAGGGRAWLPGLVTALGTLCVMVACSVWGRGSVRTLGAMVGLLCGLAASALCGLLDPHALLALEQAPLVRLPHFTPIPPAFDLPMLVPALITGLVITLNATGSITAAQRLADADWKRQDIDGLSRGLLADGLGTIVSALIGGGGVSVSGSAVGLTAAARATSRAIGSVASVGFACLALVPKFALLVLALPRPVLGAALIYLSSALVMSGITIISSRLLDARKTYTLGIAFAFAVATPALTRASPVLPEWMAPVVASPLLASALVAMLLNPILRIGIRRQVELTIPAGGLAQEEVAHFISRAGAAWGARREVIAQAQGPVAECLDALVDSDLADGDCHLLLGFNELQLDARITWRGRKLPLSDRRPTKQELLTDDDAAARMAGYLIARLASQVTSREVNGLMEVHLIFDH
jgi:NCS2 family nucleobase:cation symporter-2